MINFPIGSLILSIIFWIAGYVQIKILEDEKSNKLILCPLWLYILFGKPKNNMLPERVVTLTSASLQIMGIWSTLYLFLIRLFINIYPSIHDVIQCFTSMLIGTLAGYWLFRHNRYELS